MVWFVAGRGVYRYNVITQHVGSALLAASKHRSRNVLPDFSATLPGPDRGLFRWEYTEVTGRAAASLTDRKSGVKVQSRLTYQFPFMYCTWGIHSLRTLAAWCVQVNRLIWWVCLFLVVRSSSVLKAYTENRLFNVSAAAVFWCGLPGRGGRLDLWWRSTQGQKKEPVVWV